MTTGDRECGTFSPPWKAEPSILALTNYPHDFNAANTFETDEGDPNEAEEEEVPTPDVVCTQDEKTGDV